MDKLISMLGVLGCDMARYNFDSGLCLLSDIKMTGKNRIESLKLYGLVLNEN